MATGQQAVKFSFDYSAFQKNVDVALLSKLPMGAEKGMFEALSELKHDCDFVEPKTPHLMGDLRGNFTITVERLNTKVEGVLLFKQPYAAKWHEADNAKVAWSEAGVGSKYMETKMMVFKKKYIAIIADSIQSVK